jgi:hypothetical protein
MTLDKLQTLRQVNENLRSTLHRLRPEQTHCSTIQPQDFADLLNEIVRAADCLQGHPVLGDSDPAVEQESLEYRGNLEKLKGFLPQLHRNLLAEKSRLETAQAHVAAAATWARASPGTL